MNWMFFSGVTLVVAAYALGAVPWGVVLGKLFAGKDLRDFGSNSTGATNAYRVLGWKFSAGVFALDFCKGLVPVLLARWMDVGWWFVGAVGFASVVGHCWSAFIKFGGGKGMATGAGAIAGMVPWVLLVLPVMVLIVWATRYVSLASLAGTALATGMVALFAVTGKEPSQAAIATLGVAAVIYIRHYSNIGRLIHGNERRLSRRPASPA
jgi:acyl phosphate:glycerol-3-phosphate acyltransferase